MHQGRSFFGKAEKLLKVLADAVNSSTVRLDFSETAQVIVLGDFDVILERGELVGVVLYDCFGNGLAIVSAWIRRRLPLSP